MDRSALLAAADALAPIADVRLLEQLKSLPDRGNADQDQKLPGVTGDIAARIDTPAGAILMAAKGKTRINWTRCATWPW